MIKQAIGLLLLGVAVKAGLNDIPRRRGDQQVGPEVRHVHEFSSTAGRREGEDAADSHLHHVDDLPEHDSLGVYDEQFEDIPEFNPRYANKQYEAGYLNEDHLVAELDNLEDEHDAKFPKKPEYKHKYGSEDDDHDEVDTVWAEHPYNQGLGAAGLHQRVLHQRVLQPNLLPYSPLLQPYQHLSQSYLPLLAYGQPQQSLAHLAYAQPQVVHYHYHDSSAADGGVVPEYEPSSPAAAGVSGWADEVVYPGVAVHADAYTGYGGVAGHHGRDEREYVARASWKRVVPSGKRIKGLDSVLQHDSMLGSRQGKAYASSTSYYPSYSYGNNHDYRNNYGFGNNYGYGYADNYGYVNQKPSGKRINHSYNSQKSSAGYNSGYNTYGNLYNTGYGSSYRDGYGSSYNNGYGGSYNGYGSSYNNGYGGSYNNGYGRYGSSYNHGYGNKSDGYDNGYNNYGYGLSYTAGNNHYNPGYGKHYGSSYNQGIYDGYY